MRPASPFAHGDCRGHQRLLGPNAILDFGKVAGPPQQASISPFILLLLPRSFHGRMCDAHSEEHVARVYPADCDHHPRVSGVTSSFLTIGRLPRRFRNHPVMLEVNEDHPARRVAVVIRPSLPSSAPQARIRLESEPAPPQRLRENRRRHSALGSRAPPVSARSTGQHSRPSPRAIGRHRYERWDPPRRPGAPLRFRPRHTELRNVTEYRRWPREH
jgi:hypothetical protein